MGFNMGKTSNESKMRYNRANYKRYEIVVKIDSELHEEIEKLVKNKDISFSHIVKKLLCGYFNISERGNL